MITANYLIDFFQVLNTFFARIISIPLLNAIMLFFISALVARISFNVFLIMDKGLNNLESSIKKIAELNKNNKVNYEYFLCQYCLLTSFIVVAIQYSFNKPPDIGKTIIYSIIGPTFFKNKIQVILDTILSRIASEAIKQIDQKKKESDEKLKETIKKKIEEDKS